MTAVYQAGTDVLSTLFDCADAESPAVANLFVTRDGVIAFRGRYARLRVYDYVPGDGVNTPSKPVLVWNAGDAAAVDGQPDWAQIVGEPTWNLDKTHIYNAALVTPEAIEMADVVGQLVTDPDRRVRRLHVQARGG